MLYYLYFKKSLLGVVRLLPFYLFFLLVYFPLGVICYTNRLVYSVVVYFLTSFRNVHCCFPCCNADKAHRYLSLERSISF